MNDAEFQQARDRVSHYFVRWIPVLGFGRWRLLFSFLRSEPTDQAGRTVQVMQTEAQWEYESARFTVFLPVVHRLAADDDDLEWHVVHELTHLWQGELHDADQPVSADFYQHEERVCSRITTAILGVRDAVCIQPSNWRRLGTRTDKPSIVFNDEDCDGDIEGRYELSTEPALEP